MKERRYYIKFYDFESQKPIEIKEYSYYSLMAKDIRTFSKLVDDGYYKSIKIFAGQKCLLVHSFW